jgi:hypothetical protein
MENKRGSFEGYGIQYEGTFEGLESQRGIFGGKWSTSIVYREMQKCR